MSQKTLISIFISFFLFNAASAQPFGEKKVKFTISGKVIDKESSKPIDYASVALYLASDNKLVTGVITGQKGEFTLIDLQNGVYYLKIEFLGYEAKKVECTVLDSNVKIAESIALNVNSVLLGAVKVTGKTDEKQITLEKTKIDVSKSISNATGSISEILKNQPSVTIDNDNNIFLRGNKNILVLIDGRPTTLNALSTIPANNISNVEIITSPDVRYDSEGSGGIINIISKKRASEGFSTLLTINYGINNRFNGGLNFNYKKGIWGATLNYSGKKEKEIIASTLTREILSTSSFVNQIVSSQRNNSTNMLALSLTADPSKKDMFTLNLKGIFPSLHTEQNIKGYENDLQLNPDYTRFNDITFSRKTFEGTFSYKRIVEKGKNELSFEGGYSRTKGSRPALYWTNDILSQKSDGGGTPTNATLQADYLKVLGNGIKIEMGTKFFSRWNNFIYHFYNINTFNSEWIIDPGFSNDLEHKEYIYALYFLYSKELPNFSYKLGLRSEYSTSDISQISTGERDYKTKFSLFPYFTVRYEINKEQNLSLNYTRRITRPAYPQINPFISVIDEMTYESGNRDLLPELIDKIEFNYSLQKKQLQFRGNVYYSFTKDYISQVTTLSTDNKLLITYANANQQQKAGSDIDIYWSLSKKLSINPSFSFFYNNSTGEYKGSDLSSGGFSWATNVKFLYSFDSKTDAQLQFNYSSPVALPQFLLKSVNYTDVSIKRFFLDNKIALSLSVSDIFNTRKWEIETNNRLFHLNNYSKADSQIIWIGLSFNINSFKSLKQSKEEKSNGEEGIIKLGY